jgi:membrane peptidoglycan carboxypeptidase
MMTRVVSAGTATNAYMEKHEVAGKTGTTDSFRDAWFNGYTARYTTAVWVGNDDYSQMWTSFGGDLPARIWKEFMVFAERNNPPSTIIRNRTSKVCCLYCAESNLRAGPGCPKVYRKILGRYDVPRQYCTTHGAPVVSAVGPTKNYKDDGKAKPAPQAPKNQPGYDENAPGPVPQTVELPTDVPSDSSTNAPPPDTAPTGPADVGPPPEPVPIPVPVEVPMDPPPPPPAPAPAPEPVTQP